MSELANFIPGLVSSVNAAKVAAEVTQARANKLKAKKAAQVVTAAKHRGAENRSKVLAVLQAAGEPVGPIARIAELAGLSYNATSDHLTALVAEGLAEGAPGHRGLFVAADES